MHSPSKGQGQGRYLNEKDGLGERFKLGCWIPVTLRQHVNQRVACRAVTRTYSSRERVSIKLLSAGFWWLST
jgi:hypothetical protein